MKKDVLGLIVFCITLMLIVSSMSYGGDEKPRNIVLIGWDGAQRNHIKECLSRNELPNLKKIADEGTLVPIDILRITDTKAGWTQILTGYNPEITGVFNNSDYQPIPKGYTIFERLEKFFGSDNIVTVAVIGKKAHVDCEGPSKTLFNDDAEDKNAVQAKGKRKQQKQQVQKKAAKNQKAPEGKIVEEGGLKYRVVPGKPYYNAKGGMDLFINGLQTNDRVASETCRLLEKYKDKPFFFFVHFAEVDHQGHQFGENSKEVNDAYISSDKYTGEVINKLKELKLYDNTLIYITADHGFDEGMKAHKDAPYVFLATNDKKVIRPGERADIAPTIMDRFGLDLSKIDPPLDGSSLLRPAKPVKWQ